MVYYAVANGKNIGIFLNWDDCKKSISGYKNAIYKKFDKKEDAEDFITLNNTNTNDDKLTECSIIEINDTTFNPDYYVYTDGACSNNGKENALAGIGIFFGMDDIRNISKKIEGKQTNNTAELTAIIETFYIIENDIINGKKIAIVSDSKYAINCITSYGDKCYKKKWEIDIPNKELVKNAYEIYKNQKNIKFIYIKAHTNNSDIHSFGNDNADKLANMAIGLDNCPYNKCKIYLIVPFVEKNKIKNLGGLWDIHQKKWFIYDNNKNKNEILTLFLQE
jgi:ribonuclease HI